MTICKSCTIPDYIQQVPQDAQEEGDRAVSNESGLCTVSHYATYAGAALLIGGIGVAILGIWGGPAVVSTGVNMAIAGAAVGIGAGVASFYVCQDPLKQHIQETRSKLDNTVAKFLSDMDRILKDIEADPSGYVNGNLDFYKTSKWHEATYYPPGSAIRDRHNTLLKPNDALTIMEDMNAIGALQYRLNWLEFRVGTTREYKQAIGQWCSQDATKIPELIIYEDPHSILKRYNDVLKATGQGGNDIYFDGPSNHQIIEADDYLTQMRFKVWGRVVSDEDLYFWCRGTASTDTGAPDTGEIQGYSNTPQSDTNDQSGDDWLSKFADLFKFGDNSSPFGGKNTSLKGYGITCGWYQFQEGRVILGALPNPGDADNEDAGAEWCNKYPALCEWFNPYWMSWQDWLIVGLFVALMVIVFWILFLGGAAILKKKSRGEKVTKKDIMDAAKSRQKAANVKIKDTAAKTGEKVATKARETEQAAIEKTKAKIKEKVGL